MPDPSAAPPERRWLRSMLYVPGHKADWIDKASRYGADSLILDLEDAVPASMKAVARATVGTALESPDPDGPALFVRVNGWGTGRLLDDVIAVVAPSLTGIVLSKTAGPDDVVALDRILNEIEFAGDQPLGRIEILPLLETASSIESAAAILRASTRVARVVAVFGFTPGMRGDLHRDLGVEPSADGREMDYANGKVLVSARAAGIEHILGGMTVDVGDLDLLRRSLEYARQLGSSGTMLIHPSHVPVAHEVFTPSAADVEQNVALLAALQAARERGDAAVRHGGQMVDRAHAQSALRLLERAGACGVQVPEVVVLDDWT